MRLKRFNNHLLIIVVIALAMLSLLSYLFCDQIFFQWQKQNYNINWDGNLFIKGFTLLGKGWLLTWLLFCLALISKFRKCSLIGLTALILVGFIVLPVKSIVHRPRPRDIITQTDYSKSFIQSWSFPSGDTASVFAIVAAIGPFVGWFRRISIFSVASTIGIFRFFSFSHYPSDILAGALIGILAAYLADKIINLKPVLWDIFSKFTKSKFILAAIIIIPVVIALTNEKEDIISFSLFYPPLVVGLGVFYKPNFLKFDYNSSK